MSLTKSDLKNIGLIFDQKFDQKFEEKGIVTKDDLKDFAKKSDLKDFVTKSDLKNFVTKDDLKVLATKKDLQKIDKKFDKLFDFLDRDYLRVKRDVRDIQSHHNLPVSDF